MSSLACTQTSNLTWKYSYTMVQIENNRKKKKKKWRLASETALLWTNQTMYEKKGCSTWDSMKGRKALERKEEECGKIRLKLRQVTITHFSDTNNCHYELPQRVNFSWKKWSWPDNNIILLSSYTDKTETFFTEVQPPSQQQWLDNCSADQAAFKCQRAQRTGAERRR